jgi:branched-chain amino acid transport system ATP-binding protein
MTLRVQGLEVRYHGAVAVSGVDLDVGAGGRIGIVGRNGAGKSSLLRAIAGVVRPSAGTITWEGRDITRMSADRRVGSGIAMIPEGRRVFGSMSVANNLRVGGFINHREAGKVRDEVYDLFPILRERQSQPATQLSGGEAQMLAIGLALMSRPRLLLLDEPSIGLAPRVVSSLLATIRDLSSRGIAVVLVEQSVHLASSFAKEINALDRGRLTNVTRTDGQIDEARLKAAYLGASPN